MSTKSPYGKFKIFLVYLYKNYSIFLPKSVAVEHSSFVCLGVFMEWIIDWHWSISDPFVNVTEVHCVLMY